MNRVLIVAVGLLGLGLLRAGGEGGCDSSVVGDPTMDMWCGQKLCAWENIEGEVRRVATWHRSDYGVELVGNPVVLEQVAPVTSVDCLEVRVQADREPGVNLQMKLDLDDDGSVEHTEPLTSTGYHPQVFHLRIERQTSAMRFVLRKTGEGRAVLAEFKPRGVGVSDCSGAPVVK